MDPVIIDEETGLDNGAILMVDTSFPRIQEVYIRSELPNKESVMSLSLIHI